MPQRVTSSEGIIKELAESLQGLCKMVFGQESPTGESYGVLRDDQGGSLLLRLRPSTDLDDLYRGSAREATNDLLCRLFRLRLRRERTRSSYHPPLGVKE